MLRIIIPVLFCINCISHILGQVDFNSHLMELEKEYYDAKNDTIKNLLVIKKIDLYLSENKTSQEVLHEVKRVDYSMLPNSDLHSFLWNASLIAYFNKDTYYSLHYIDEYAAVSGDSSVEMKILKLMIYSAYDTTIAADIIQDLTLLDSNFSCLNCLIEIQQYELKHKSFLKNTSFFIPGMGMLLNGNVLKGSTSLLLNTGTVFAIRWLLQQNLYVNMISWGSNLAMKFYAGNIQLTKKLIDKKEDKQRKKLADNCELLTQKIVSEFPLFFR